MSLQLFIFHPLRLYPARRPHLSIVFITEFSVKNIIDTVNLVILNKRDLSTQFKTIQSLKKTAENWHFNKTASLRFSGWEKMNSTKKDV